MEWESESPCCSHTYPRQGRRSPGRPSDWELELGTVEQFWGEGCCWLQRDGLRGCEGGDCGGKCLWRKARQPWKKGNTAESHVGGGFWVYSHARIRSWTIERLAHQTLDALNYRVGTPPRVPLSVPDTQICRVGPHPGCPFKWLMRQSTE